MRTSLNLILLCFFDCIVGGILNVPISAISMRLSKSIFGNEDAVALNSLIEILSYANKAICLIIVTHITNRHRCNRLRSFLLLPSILTDCILFVLVYRGEATSATEYTVAMCLVTLLGGEIVPYYLIYELINNTPENLDHKDSEYLKIKSAKFAAASMQIFLPIILSEYEMTIYLVPAAILCKTTLAIYLCVGMVNRSLYWKKFTNRKRRAFAIVKPTKTHLSNEQVIRNASFAVSSIDEINMRQTAIVEHQRPQQHRQLVFIVNAKMYCRAIKKSIIIYLPYLLYWSQHGEYFYSFVFLKDRLNETYEVIRILKGCQYFGFLMTTVAMSILLRGRIFSRRIVAIFGLFISVQSRCVQVAAWECNDITLWCAQLMISILCPSTGEILKANVYMNDDSPYTGTTLIVSSMICNAIMNRIYYHVSFFNPFLVTLFSMTLTLSIVLIFQDRIFRKDAGACNNNETAAITADVVEHHMICPKYVGEKIIRQFMDSVVMDKHTVTKIQGGRSERLIFGLDDHFNHYLIIAHKSKELKIENACSVENIDNLLDHAVRLTTLTNNVT